MGMWITYQYIEHQVMPPYRKYIKANPELEMIAPFECVATNQGTPKEDAKSIRTWCGTGIYPKA